MARMSGKHALMEQLRADGVRHVFGNPGTTEQGFMDLLQDYPDIQFVLALHEGVAVSMADAYARLTRRPAFVELHVAPGLGNALGMLHNARVGSSPLVVYAGQSP
ncbi:MAG: thiamine pyrophosphate-binding protein, partial [Chloroflexota bacterium]|nr:thiamine pyrophosphate-binding protein [Chloroflexota bacterium]